ncbi:MAG TPA: hypothetical protein VI248_29390 [Kineosporiaceae bacterium]
MSDLLPSPPGPLPGVRRWPRRLAVTAAVVVAVTGVLLVGTAVAGSAAPTAVVPITTGGLVRDALTGLPMCTAASRRAAAAARTASPFGPQWWKRKLTMATFTVTGGPRSTQLRAINDAGIAVGTAGGGGELLYPSTGFLIRAPYRQGDVVRRTVPGARQTVETGINRFSVHVGSFVGKDGATSGFVWFGDTLRAVRDPLGRARPSIDRLFGISDTGWAAGAYDDEKGLSHGYLYDVCRGTFQPIGIPVAHTNLEATGVNAKGVVVGNFATGESLHGFVLDRGRFTPLDLGNATQTQVLGVDNAGDLVGSYVDRTGATLGFVWSNGRVRSLSAPGAAGCTVVSGVNGRGRLAGYFTTVDRRTVGFVAT